MHRFIALAFSSALAVADPAHAQVAVTILHTSEHHGTLQPIEHGPFAGLGGVERRAALINQTRQEVEHLLVVDSGDLLMGTAMSSVFRGEVDIAVMNLMGYDADRKSTRLNSSHSQISYAVFCLKKKNFSTKPVRAK